MAKSEPKKQKHLFCFTTSTLDQAVVKQKESILCVVFQMAYVIEASSGAHKLAPELLPMHKTLKNGQNVQIDRMSEEYIDEAHALLNEVIREGSTSITVSHYNHLHSCSFVDAPPISGS